MNDENNRYLARAKALRNAPDVHYNCAQAVVMAFAKEAGLTTDQAKRITANFGSGMKMGATCGAITGGLMVLGLFGADDGKTVRDYYGHFKASHDGMLNCRDLLAANMKTGRTKKEHCDGMVYEAVTLVRKMLMKRGLIAA